MKGCSSACRKENTSIPASDTVTSCWLMWIASHFFRREHASSKSWLIYEKNKTDINRQINKFFWLFYLGLYSDFKHLAWTFYYIIISLSICLERASPRQMRLLPEMTFQEWRWTHRKRHPVGSRRRWRAHLWTDQWGRRKYIWSVL